MNKNNFDKPKIEGGGEYIKKPEVSGISKEETRTYAMLGELTQKQEKYLSLLMLAGIRVGDKSTIDNAVKNINPDKLAEIEKNLEKSVKEINDADRQYKQGKESINPLTFLYHGLKNSNSMVEKLGILVMACGTAQILGGRDFIEGMKRRMKAKSEMKFNRLVLQENLKRGHNLSEKQKEEQRLAQQN